MNYTKWHHNLIWHTCHKTKWSFTISWICWLGHTSLLRTWQLNSCGFWTLTSNQRFRVFAWSRASMKEPKKRILLGGRNKSSSRFDFFSEMCLMPVTLWVNSSSCRSASICIIQHVIYANICHTIYYNIHNICHTHTYNTYGFLLQSLWIYRTHYLTTVEMNTLAAMAPVSLAWVI